MTEKQFPDPPNLTDEQIESAIAKFLFSLNGVHIPNHCLPTLHSYFLSLAGVVGEIMTKRLMHGYDDAP